MNQFPPQPQSISLGPFRIFLKIRGDIRKSRCTTGINNTGGKFATGINDTGSKFCHQFPLCCWHPPPVSTIPAANLRPVSTMPVANCHRYQRHRRQICHRCCWHRWQIIRTISGFKHLKVNLKAKIYLYVNSTTQRCPNKIIKIFLLEDFSICHRCRWHWWCTFSREYLSEFSKKFEMAVMVYSDAWGKLIHEKTRSRKSRDTVPLNDNKYAWSATPLFMICSKAFCFIRFLANNYYSESSRGRVVKALDLKSNGDSPRRFEPCRLRKILDQCLFAYLFRNVHREALWLHGNIFFTLNYNNVVVLKKYCKARKEGGREWYRSNLNDLIQTPMFFRSI